MPRARLIYRGYDVMPWCGRCGVGISEHGDEGRLQARRAPGGVREAAAARTGPDENLLVWTTTPWTLTSNVGAAVNPELTYLKVKLKGEMYYVAKGVFKQNRMEVERRRRRASRRTRERRNRKRDWLDGVPHLKTIEQIFKEKAGKEGFEIVGEVKGEDMLGWEYDGPFDDLPAQQHAYGFPEEVAKIVKQQRLVPAASPAQKRTASSPAEGRHRKRRHRHRPHRPRLRRIDFHWGKENGLPPVAPLDDSGTFLDGFGPLTGKNRRRPGDGRCRLRRTEEEGSPVRHRAVRPPLSALLALQDGTALSPRR